MLGAGKRDRKIAFERASVTKDSHNEEVSTWSVWCAAWAAVRFGSSAERRQSAAEQASQAATFRVLTTAKTRAVTERDRIVMAGAAWDIEGPPALIGRTELEFTATRAG
ncbi:phage head completion protein [Tsuneonella sp. HG222]